MMVSVMSRSPLQGEALARLQRSFMSAPFNRLTGMEFERYHDDGGVTLSMPLAEHHMNGAGVAHGGATLTLADVAISFAIARTVGGRCTTVEIKINYLRPVTGGVLHGRSHIVRAGRRLVVGRCEVHCKGKRVAEALATFAVLESRKA